MLNLGTLFVAAFRQAANLEGLGCAVEINGIDLRGVFTSPELAAAPWDSGGQDGEAPKITLIVSDLEENSLWPLDQPEIIVNDTTYRLIDSTSRTGLIDIFLQEAE
ncbi:hypothetical protein KAI46_10335 [bacterium]|nr:hypothetical protein [bacterium]